MNVQPGATFEAFSPEFASGLTGTVGVRIRDGAGADFLARTTASITADVTVGATSVYRRSLTAPTVAGQFWVIWDDGTTVASPQELVVTYSAPSATGSDLYVTRAQLKTTLELTGTTYADDDIDLACEAASRAIDGYTGSRFYPTTETRYYTALEYGYFSSDGFTNEATGRSAYIDIDDAVTVSSVTVDMDGNGSYDQTWVEGTDFFLDPANASIVGQPVRRLVLTSAGGRTLPSYSRAIKVTGSFGWATPPAQVRQAAVILARRLVARKDTPFGFAVAAGDVVSAARLGRIDPDVAFMLDNLPGKKNLLFV